MEAQKRTVEEIKEWFPNLFHKNDKGYHTVGYNVNGPKGKAYLIQGTGTTEEEAWQEAHEWLTRTGRYDPEVDYYNYQKKSEDPKKQKEVKNGTDKT